MTYPLVSIIIPCYNAAGYVHEAIQSALDQDYPSKELIVVDDGSTDSTLSVVQKFGTKVRWVTGPNLGAPAARNRGVALAQGEFVQFLDADDLLHPNKLSEQVPLLVEGRFDLVYSDWRLFRYGPNPRVEICSVIQETDDPVVLVLARENLATEAPLHRRQILLSTGSFREDLPCCQDFDLHLRLASHGVGFHRLPKVLHDVRLRQESLSSDELKVLRWRYTILLDGLEFLTKKGQLSDQRRQAFAAALTYRGRRLMRFGQKDQAKTFFRMAYKVHPTGGTSGAFSRAGSAVARLVGPAWAETISTRFKRTIARLIR